MKRAALALAVVLAAAAGLAGGLLYTWVLDPGETYQSAPDSLYFEDKLVYLALIGDLYVYEGDPEQAAARLAQLDVEADGPALAALIEQYLDGGGQPEVVRGLARLAGDLGASGGVLLVFGSTPRPSPTPVPTIPAQDATPAEPAAASTPAPATQTGVASPAPSTPAPSAPSFRLVEQTSLCAEPEQPGQILVWVRDAQGNELAGVQIVASWGAGQDRFFTGLQPELGVGYADFEMRPELSYDVTLADFEGDVAQALSSELSPGLCPTDTIALNWRLVFQQTP